MLFLMSLLAMKAQCEAKHSVLIESLNHHATIWECVLWCALRSDGLCITNGSRLVVVGDEPYLSLFPRLWHAQMCPIPNQHKCTHEQCPYLAPELHLETVNV